MNRLLVRTASNAYFAQRLTVLSLPEESDRIRVIVKRLWPMLKDADSADKLAMMRQLLSDVERFADSLREFCNALDEA